MTRVLYCSLVLGCVLAAPRHGVAFETPSDEAAPPVAPEGPKYDFKYKFKELELVRTEIVHRATVQTTIQGTSQTAETQSKSVKSWRIDKINDDGTFTFTHSVESIDMWQKMQGRPEIRYNSTTDSEVPPGYEDVAQAVGVPLTIVTMDNRGKILKRFEKRAQPVGASTQMTMPLPPEPVAVGQSWSNPVNIDVVTKDGGQMKVKTRQKFVLEKVESDVATIAVDSQVLTPIADPAIEAQLIQRMSSGSVRFDLAAGRVLSQQLDLDRHVIGFSGASSSMHYLTRFTETLLNRDASSPAPEVKPQEPLAKTNAAKKDTTNPSAPKTTSPRVPATTNSAQGAAKGAGPKAAAKPPQRR
jgi:hypothetical protein